MLFDRRRNDSQPPDARAEYRYPLPADHPLVMQLVRPDGEVIDVLPVDLTARGAGFRAWPDVTIEADEIFDVVVASETDGWTVRTPGMVRHGTHDGEAVDWGVEFINLGNLYGQWDNVLGRYFNRRKERRVTPELDRKISAELMHNGRVITASVHDVSASGAGLAVRHIEAGDLEREQAVQLTFQLPRCRREMSGEATIRQVRRAGAQAFIGLEFDQEDPEGFRNHERQIHAYCDRRARAISDWEDAWQGAA